MKRCIIDIESSGLLEDMIDYSSFPYKLKQTAKLWCVVVRDYDTNEIFSAVKEEITSEWMEKTLLPFEHIIFHNGIKFDIVALKLFGVVDYTIGYLNEMDTLFGREVRFIDTLILSRIVNPDRLGGHGLHAWGLRTNNLKIGFRELCIEDGIIEKTSPKGAEFLQYSPRMLEYCIGDTSTNASAYEVIIKELQGYDGWKQAIRQEHKLADLAVRRENLGFWFDKELALELLEDLTDKMEKLTNSVNPNLPLRPLKAIELSKYTPPKQQLKADGSYTASFIRFTESLGGVLKDGAYHLDGQLYQIPILEPLRTNVRATIDDLDAVKMHLIDLGWNPSEWRERDLTKDSKKQNLTLEKREKVLDRWIKETLGGKYKEQRLAVLGMTESNVYQKLRKNLGDSKPIRVPTSPSVRVGIEKELCPNLVELGEKVSFAKDFSDYLTYKHRKSTIAGGDIEDMDFNNEVPNTGFLKMYREQDGRVPTPAIEIGASTNRYTHIGIANIPRASSIYGKEMRSLFGAGEGFVQLGFDFSSLENRIQGNYVFNGTDGQLLAERLIADKPHDLHCYSEDTEILTQDGWKTFGNLALKDYVAQYNPENLESEWVKPNEIVWEKYKGNMISLKNKNTDQLVTPNHRVYTIDCKTSKGKITLAEDFKNKIPNTSEKFLNGGLIKTHYNIKTSFVKLLVATQADGYLNKDSSAITFSFTRKDKCLRLENILDDLKAKYSCRIHNRKDRDEITYRVKASELTVNIRKWLSKSKELLPDVMNIGHNQRLALIEEVQYWDGTVGKSGIILDTTCLSTVNTLQAVCSSLGIKSTITKFNKKTNLGVCKIHRLFISKKVKCWSGTYSLKKEIVNYEGHIGCVSVPSGLVVVRRNGKVFVSGNTINSEKLGITRTDAKSFTYAILYGASPKKVAKMLNCSMERAEQLVKEFWEAVPALNEQKLQKEQEWVASGKKYIRGIDGRKINIRSQHSILNALFQSGGVIGAKYTNIILSQKLENMGYNIDCFKGRPDVAEMISYHDEEALAVSDKIIKYQTFKTEEEGKEFIKNWNGSQLGELNFVKQWYIALPNPVSEAILESIDEVGKILNLNVPLGIGWAVGKNWYQTH